ncbi:MAG: hypothetical protein ACP5JU_01480 [Minisyncoccia bacterium]
MRKKNKRRLNRRPPFYWSLSIQSLLFFLIFFEMLLLVQNRAWSQNYLIEIKKIRDQAEKLTYEQELISKKLGEYYNFLNSNQVGYKEAERRFLPIQNITFKPGNNE